MFKDPIEAPDQAAGPILDPTEIKEIFGNLPPIYETHCNIKDRLERLTNRITLNEESVSVGEIYLDNVKISSLVIFVKIVFENLNKIYRLMRYSKSIRRF